MQHLPQSLANRMMQSVQPALTLAPETLLDEAIVALGQYGLDHSQCDLYQRDLYQRNLYQCDPHPPDLYQSSHDGRLLERKLPCTDCILVQSSSGFVGMLGSQELIRAMAGGQDSSQRTLADWMRSDILCLKLADLQEPCLSAPFFAQLEAGFATQPILPVVDHQQRTIGVIPAGAIVQILLEERRSVSGLEQAQFQEMITQIPGLLYRYVLRPDGTDAFPYLSPSFRELCGFEPEVGIENTELVWQLIHPDDVPQMRAGAAVSAQTLELWNHSYRMITPSGELKWLLATSRPHRRPNGDIVWDGLLVDITPYKQIELALQVSEDRYRMLAENLSDSIYLVDGRSLQLLYLSPAAETIFGQPRKFFLEDNPNRWLSCIHPDDRAAVEQSLRQAIAEPQDTLELYYRIVRPDGEIRYLRETVSFFRSATGSLLSYQGITCDLTEIRQAEVLLQQMNQELELRVQERTQELVAAQAALNQREHAFRSLAHNSPDLILRIDRQMRYLYVNPVMEAIMQCPADQIIGKTSYDMGFPTELVEFWRATYNRICETHQQQQVEFKVKTPKGEIHFQSKMVPEFDASGEIVSFLVVSRDITELKQIQADLQESETRFRQLAETVDDIFWLAEPIPGTSDRELRYLYVNSAFSRIWGQSLDLLYQSSNAWFETIHPDDRARVMDALLLQLQENYDYEYRIIRPDGEIRWVRDRTFPIYDEAGRVYRLAGIVQDITERKQFEQTLHEAYHELEQRVEERTADLKTAKEAAEAASYAKSTFLANMSHELRTPLNAILGFTQLLCREPSLTPSQYEQINIINRSGEHLLHLINDILEMSKIEAGRAALNPIAFDLHYLLETLEEMLRLRAVSKGLELRFDTESALPQYIYTDEGKLRQVLINLLSNAIKFTARGRVTLRVQSLSNARSHPMPPNPPAVPPPDPDAPTALTDAPSSLAESYDPRLLLFQIEDTGCGIAPEEMGSLFEPFVQTRSGRTASEGGTGLGLPISREFVRLMGGELTVSSAVNHGSIFTVYLPVTIVGASLSMMQRTPRRVVGLSANQPSYRILVVEDQEANRKLLVTLFQQIGFAVKEATNGQEAIDFWRSWKPHLIWMDMRMPIMNGDEAAYQIRALEAEEMEQGSRGAGESTIHPSTHPPTHPSTKIIALTASAFEEDRAKMLAIGCDDFVPKPFDQEMLLEKLASHLNVEYIYSDDLTDRPTQHSFALERSLNHEQLYSLTVEQLQVMPLEWIEQLYQSSIQLDSSRIMKLIEQIPTDHEPLTLALTVRVDNFQFEEIMDLAEAACFPEEAL